MEQTARAVPDQYDSRLPKCSLNDLGPLDAIHLAPAIKVQPKTINLGAIPAGHNESTC